MKLPITWTSQTSMVANVVYPSQAELDDGFFALNSATPFVNLFTVIFITRIGQVVVSWVKTVYPEPLVGGTKLDSLNTYTEKPTFLLTATTDMNFSNNI